MRCPSTWLFIPRALCAPAFALAAMLPLAGARANDTCATAAPLSPDTTVVGSNAEATDDNALVCAPATSRDVWYSVIPVVSGLHTISLCGSSFDTVLSVHTTCGGFPIACNDDSCGTSSQVVTSLVAGTVYRLRVAASGGGAAGGMYSLTVTSPSVSGPLNNACSTATVLEPGVTLEGTSIGANGSDVSPCGDADSVDVWYTYLASQSGTHVVSVCSVAMDTVVSVHPSCFGAALACDDNSPTSCGPSGSQVSFIAAAGTAYRVRVAGTFSSFGTFNITLHAPIANDACSAAIPLSLGVAYNGRTNPTCQSEGAATCAGASGADVWHTFNAPVSGAHVFSLCDSGFDTAMSIYSGCPGLGGVELACADNECGEQSEATLTLAAGSTYWIRVAGKAGANGLADIGPYTVRVSFAQPPNDLCANATPLQLAVPITGSTIGATGVDETPCGINDFRDVWYAFTPPSSGFYEFNTCASPINTTLAVFENCGGPALGCADDNFAFCGNEGDDASLLLLLNEGQTYLVRVAGTQGTQGAIRLVVYGAPPVNDACANAATLFVNTHLAGTTTGGTGTDLSACGSFDTVDVWFAFTPELDGYYQISACGSPGDTVLSLHTACGVSSFACSDNDALCAPGDADGRLSVFLNSGVRTLIRLSHNNGLGGAYIVSVTLAPPPNDQCAAASTILFDVPILATNVGATGTDLTPCGENDRRDVWFRFVPPATGTYQVTTCIAVNNLNTTVSVWNACGGAMLACSASDASCGGGNEDLAGVSLLLSGGQPALIRVAGEGDSEGLFGLRVRFARPANDVCQTATAVSEGSYDFETWGATSDAISFNATCGGGLTSLVRDVWFRYQPTQSGVARLSLCDSTFDTYMVLSDANLGCPVGIYQILACNDNFDCDGIPGTLDTQSTIVYSVQSGRSYFVHVGSRSDTPGQGTLAITLTPDSCPCDWNQIGGLTVQDIYDFFTSWNAGNADFNNSGATTVQDIYDFLTCFEGGC